MNRANILFPCFIAALIALIRSSSSSPNESSTANNKPHVLFLLVDDLGWTDISKHNAEYETKNIDQLLDSGIELTNYYVHLDCSPTRSAIMTGQYSFKNGLQNIATIGPGTMEHIPFENPTFAELMKKESYSTHMLGKWHLGYAAWNMTPTGRGFDSYFGYMQGMVDYYNHTVANGYDFWSNQDDIHAEVMDQYSTGLYDQYLHKIVEDYNKSSKSEPLFVYMAFQTVHTPIEISPNAYDECNDIKYEGRKIYCNKMQYLDNTIADYINLFKAYNLWDDTLVILSTDNGGMPYWENNQGSPVVSYGCNMPYRAGKATLFQGGVHGIGGITGGDNVIPSHLRGTKSDIMTHAIDWVPTVLQGVLGTKLPDNVPFDGISMWDALMHPAQANSLWNRTTLYIDIEKNGTFAGIIDGDMKFFQGEQMYTAYFPCNGTYTPYDNTSDTDTVWLFNIATDPGEYNNLAKDNPDLVKKYQNMIYDFVANGGYEQEQDAQFYPESRPQNHNGSWAPWVRE